MKILHTADWHLGQAFYEFDRSFEHQQFLYWLVDTLKAEDIDCLIISGDVFDLSNPSVAAVRLFYTFLNNAVRGQPGLQVIVTAGNHDSATRLESPKPLLESSNIHIIGTIDRIADGTIDLDKLVIPIHDKQSDIKIWCMAIPFLRMGDYPVVAETEAAYAAGVAALYEMVYAHALAKKQPGQAIMAMGHLHTLEAEITEHDSHERPIMGGVEFIPASAFHPDIVYTALGHIHKAQRFGPKQSIRYSGSPIPMSFAELSYVHKVIAFEVEGETIKEIKNIEVPLTVALLRVPQVSKPLADVLLALYQLPDEGENMGIAPFLEVRVLLDGPEPGLRHKIETALSNKHVRLAKIDVKYKKDTANTESDGTVGQKLDELNPVTVFNKLYQSRYQTEAPETMIRLFREVLQSVNTKEEQL